MTAVCSATYNRVVENADSKVSFKGSKRSLEMPLYPFAWTEVQVTILEFFTC